MSRMSRDRWGYRCRGRRQRARYSQGARAPRRCGCAGRGLLGQRLPGGGAVSDVEAVDVGGGGLAAVETGEVVELLVLIGQTARTGGAGQGGELGPRIGSDGVYINVRAERARVIADEAPGEEDVRAVVGGLRVAAGERCVRLARPDTTVEIQHVVSGGGTERAAGVRLETKDGVESGANVCA